jgi:hypothetical protein
LSASKHRHSNDLLPPVRSTAAAISLTVGLFLYWGERASLATPLRNSSRDSCPDPSTSHRSKMDWIACCSSVGSFSRAVGGRSIVGRLDPCGAGWGGVDGGGEAFGGGSSEDCGGACSKACAVACRSSDGGVEIAAGLGADVGKGCAMGGAAATCGGVDN